MARRRSAPWRYPGGATRYHLVVPDLVEGEDFYFEGPYMVFTEKFLRARGYCCESGCRHCPWGFRRTVRNDGPIDEPDPQAD
jgi:hypothetical protein